MKYSTKAVAFATACFAWGLNSAYADDGFYIGGSVGNATVEKKAASTDIDIKSDNLGYKVYGGFKFSMFAVEGGYVNFGDQKQDDNELELAGWDIFGMLNLGLGPVDLFAKLGAFAWNSDVIVEGVKASDDSGTDPVYGLGVGVSLGSFSVRAEYEYFDLSNFEDVNMFSVGGTYTF